MVTTSGQLTGPEALNRLDQNIVSIRNSLSEAMVAADAAEARQAQIRDTQVAAYRQLAAIRLDVLRDSNQVTVLADLQRKAQSLLDDHAQYVQREAEALTQAAGAVKDLEEQRAAVSRQHEEAIDRYEQKVAEVEKALLDDPEYTKLDEAHEAAAAIAERARQKLDVAETDRDEKGMPYDADPLFSYLWKRKFRTPAYKASPFIRFMDNWVARICDYDDAYLNYKRLTELPVRLAEHVEMVEAKADEALDALEAAEEIALRNAGAESLRSAADELLADIGTIDKKIEEAEQRHHEIAARHERALRSEEGPAVKAQRMLEEGLKQASVPDLRVLASETIDLKDDQIVDDLIRLRHEAELTATSAEGAAALPKRLRDDLTRMEDLRRQFKHARLDSSYTVFTPIAFEDVLTGMVRDRMDPDAALKMLKRAARRLSPRTQAGFGGRRRRSTLGLPDVLGEVLWEVGREMSRGDWGGSNMPGPFNGPMGGRRTRRTSRPRVSFPRSSGGGRRGGGGFKTGGGF